MTSADLDYIARAAFDYAQTQNAPLRLRLGFAALVRREARESDSWDIHLPSMYRWYVSEES